MSQYKLPYIESILDNFLTNRPECKDYASQFNKIFNKIMIDLYLYENQYIFNAELPGVKKSDISVLIEDNQLVINANKTIDKKYIVSLNERFSGTLSRKVVLPVDCDMESIKSSYEEGILTVKIDRKVKQSRSVIVD